MKLTKETQLIGWQCKFASNKGWHYKMIFKEIWLFGLIVRYTSGSYTVPYSSSAATMEGEWDKLIENKTDLTNGKL